MECRLDLVRFDRLLLAGDQYLHRGYPLERLTPLAAVDAGFLPANWLAPDESNTIFASSGLWLGPWRGNRISVGVNASSGCMERMIARYGHDADQVFFPYPRSPIAQV